MAYGFIPAPYSMLAGAHKLPAGCHLVYDIQTGSTNIDSYWSYEQQPDSFIHERPLNEVKEEFYSLLGSAVQKRLGADVPVGCFLSGGLDSSTITSLATAQAGRDQIQTFNIAFDDASFDESIHAEKVSRFLNTHHRYETCTMDHARSLLDEIITGLDEPLGDASLLPTSLVSQIASKSVKVALGGDGADELLSGYDPFRALLPARYYRKAIPMPIHRFIQKLAGSLTVSHRNMSLDFKIKRTLRGLSYHPELWAPVWMAPISFSDLQILSGQTLDIEDVYSEAIAAWQRGFQAGGWHSALTQYYVQLYLQDNILTKIDRASMRYGLEVRSPFLDIDVINFIRTLPQSFRFRNGTSKWLLRQTMKQKVPNFVLQRSKKGFGVPAGKWLKDETVNIDTSSFPSSWSHSKVRELTHLHRSGQKDERASLWNIWILNKWHRSFTK
jgi:asparagine synthase (glutamine-hydrolysing)